MILKDIEIEAEKLANRGLAYGTQKDVGTLAFLLEELAKYLQQKDKVFTEQWEPLLRMKRGEKNG